MKIQMFVACLVAAMVLVNQLSSAEAGPPKGKGWKSLFNGNDLIGWTYKEGTPEEAKTVWSVVDGVIDCNPKIEPRRVDKSLYTEQEFKDYQLYIYPQKGHGIGGDVQFHLFQRILDFFESALAPKAP